eukprot:g4206.t1
MGAGGSIERGGSSGAGFVDIGTFRQLRSVYDKGVARGEDDAALFKEIKSALAQGASASASASASAARAKRVDTMVQNIDLDYVLSSQMGEYYFTSWVFAGAGPAAAQLFGLILEIRDYHQAKLDDPAGDDHRQRRAGTIMCRFCPLRLGLSQLIDVRERMATLPPAAPLPPDLFDDAYAEAKRRMERAHFPAFRETEHFQKLGAELKQALSGNRARLAMQVGGGSTRVSRIDNEQEVAPWLRGSGGAGAGMSVARQRAMLGAPKKSLPPGLASASSPAASPALAAARSPIGGDSPLVQSSPSPSQPSPSRSPSGTGVGARRMSSQSRRIAVLQFADLLSDRLGSFLFKSFCRSCFEEPSLLFCLESGAYAKQAAAASDSVESVGADELEQMVTRGTAMHRKYLDQGGTLELKLPPCVRARVTRALLQCGACSSTTSVGDRNDHRAEFLVALKAARDDRLSYLEKEVWTQFLNSSMFKAWAAKLLPRIEAAVAKRERETQRQAAQQNLMAVIEDHSSPGRQRSLTAPGRYEGNEAIKDEPTKGDEYSDVDGEGKDTTGEGTNAVEGGGGCKDASGACH